MLGAAVALATVLAAASLLEATVSLKGGVGFLRLFRRSRARPPGDFAPPLNLILPCKGVDPGLEENLEAFFRLDYHDFQLLLVTGEPSDPCVGVLETVRARHPNVTSQVLFAGSSRTRGQKVHNLLHAIRHLRERDRALAFADSDIRPSPLWLRHLVGALADPGVGVSTGFRWYVPRRGNCASVLRSAWNAGIASLLGKRNPPFAWGGAMAMRRETFDACRIVDYWDGALSDDYAVTRAMRDHGLAIRFQPHCLSFSHEDCGLRALLDWSFRQLAITRVYAPSLWRLGLLSETLSNVSFWGGLGVLAAGGLGRAAPGAALWTLGTLIAATYAIRCLKAWLRLRAVGDLFPEQWRALRRYRRAYVLWGPLASLVTLSGLLRSLFTREIEWRGVRYRITSPDETVILSRSSGAEHDTDAL